MTNIKTLYTSGKDGEQKLALYQLPELDLTECIVRSNKTSSDGIALTVSVVLEKDFESTVSKSGQEKGVTAVKLNAGDILIFDVNVPLIDTKTKETNKHCQVLIDGFTHAGVLPESIIRLTFDGPGIPSKGISKKQILMNLEDKEDSVFFIEKEWEKSEDDERCIEALMGSKYVERQGYAKKTPDEYLKERLTVLEKGMLDMSDDSIVARTAMLLGCDIKVDAESATPRWKVDGTKWTTFVTAFLAG